MQRSIADDEQLPAGRFDSACDHIATAEGPLSGSEENRHGTTTGIPLSLSLCMLELDRIDGGRRHLSADRSTPRVTRQACVTPEQSVSLRR